MGARAPLPPTDDRAAPPERTKNRARLRSPRGPAGCGGHARNRRGVSHEHIPVNRWSGEGRDHRLLLLSRSIVSGGHEPAEKTGRAVAWAGRNSQGTPVNDCHQLSQKMQRTILLTRARNHGPAMPSSTRTMRAHTQNWPPGATAPRACMTGGALEQRPLPARQDTHTGHPLAEEDVERTEQGLNTD